ncbi:MAG: hypothetical protein HOM31_14875 [Gemmatimonadetes bacterium]|nr:hypothetical protein [Gemmatimonadota bacterium]
MPDPVQDSIDLSIVEPLGLQRRKWPWTLGVPFPEGCLSCDADLTLTRDGQPQCVQTRTMLSWPDGSAKWVLVDGQTDLIADDANRLQLNWADGGSRPDPTTTVAVRETADGTYFIESGDRRIAIAPSGPLPFARVYTSDAAIIPDGGIESSLRIDDEVYELRAGGRVEIEEPGPLRVVLRVDGLALGSDGTPGFDATVRIYAYSGVPWVRIYLTLTNRLRRPFVHLQEFKINLRPDLGPEAEAFLASSVDVGNHKSHVDELVDGFRSLQVGLVDMEFPAWEPAVGEDETPEQPRRAAPNYELRPAADDTQSELRSGANWCHLVPAAAIFVDGSRRISMQCRRFWHQAPKEMALSRDAAQLSLYGGWAEPVEWYRGVAKTHEIIIGFDEEAGADRQEALAFAAGFEKQPAVQVETRNWIVDSGAFGSIFRYQPESYRWWEYVLRSPLQGHTFNVETDPSLGYHFFNYGDYWTPGRGGQWKNNEMDKGYGLILQMIRSGEGMIWEHIEPIIHHQIDVDTIHDNESPWLVGAQRYHFAKHGAMRGPSLCHEWIEGPLLFGLLSGYRRAEEVALARAEHFIGAIERGDHRVKTLTRVAGYPLMAMSKMYEHYHDEKYLATSEKILDWLQDWCTEDGHYSYNAYTPPGTMKVATSLSDGILACALMRHHQATGSERSMTALQEMVDRDLDETGLFRPEGFSTKGTSPFRNYYEPEPDFWFEALLFLTSVSGEPRYADVGYAELQRIFASRGMLQSATESPPHFYRYWLPALARADELGLLGDPKPF